MACATKGDSGGNKYEQDSHKPLIYTRGQIVTSWSVVPSTGDHHITADVLAVLLDTDALKDIGVATVEQRLTILNAVYNKETMFMWVIDL